MNWDTQSNNKPVLFFKHSTRCSISDMVLQRLERDWKDEYTEKIVPVYLDLLKHRDVSNKIAEKYGVYHESPQVLIIKEGKCVYTASHSDIRLAEIMAHV